MDQIPQFQFDENVAAVFDDMISRSVPRYQDVHLAKVRLALKLCRKGGRIVDLGCSTGTTLLSIAEAVKKANLQVELIGLDSSTSMVDQARRKASALGFGNIVQFECQDVTEAEYSEVDLFIMNYTLQFLPVSKRQSFLEKLCKAQTRTGGVIVTEKLKHEGERCDDILRELYYDFKRENGYSELEIAQKREALEGFLVPVTLNENLAMFKNAGYAESELYLKWINFATFVALKEGKIE